MPNDFNYQNCKGNVTFPMIIIKSPELSNAQWLSKLLTFPMIIIKSPELSNACSLPAQELLQPPLGPPAILSSQFPTSFSASRSREC